jgi:hypothetical protein
VKVRNLSLDALVEDAEIICVQRRNEVLVTFRDRNQYELDVLLDRDRHDGKGRWTPESYGFDAGRLGRHALAGVECPTDQQSDEPHPTRMVKIIEVLDSARPAMMDSLHEEERLGAPAGVRV